MAKPKIEKSSGKPAWLSYSEKDIEAIVVKLGKQGMTSEKIGLVLRDSYGIPKAKLLGKRIGKILRENSLYKDAALSNLEKKREKIAKHLEKGKKDRRASRALAIINTRIRKIKRE